MEQNNQSYPSIDLIIGAYDTQDDDITMDKYVSSL